MIGEERGREEEELKKIVIGELVGKVKGKEKVSSVSAWPASLSPLQKLIQLLSALSGRLSPPVLFSLLISLRQLLQLHKAHYL